jgi:Protein of unknown function (DUF2924)
MPRVKIAPASPDRESIDVEIARLRDLDVASLQSRWHTVLGRRPPPHLPRHLLFRILAYRLQADRLGDLDNASRALLDRSGSPEDAGRSAADSRGPATTIRPGTVLGREWNGQIHRVAVLADSFAWSGRNIRAYRSWLLRSPAPAGTGPSSSVSATNRRRRFQDEERISKDDALRYLHACVD